MGGGRSRPVGLVVAAIASAAIVLAAGLCFSVWSVARVLDRPVWSTALARGGLRPSDVAGHADEEVTADAHATSLDYASLEWCDQVVASEHHRVARFGATAYDAQGNDEWGSEVVEYDSVASAELAMREARSATCPHFAVTDYYTSNDALRHWWVSTDTSDALPSAEGLDRYARRVDLTDTDGTQTQNWVEIFLRRGRVLVDLSGPGIDVTLMAIDGHDTIGGVTGVIQSRLLAMSAGTVGVSGLGAGPTTPLPATTTTEPIRLPPAVTVGTADRAALGQQYLAAARRANAALHTFENGESQLGPHPSRPEVAELVAPYARAQRTFDDAVASMRLLPGMVDDRNDLLTADAKLARDLGAFGSSRLPDRDTWKDQISSDQDMGTGAADAFRAELGLPNAN